MNKTVLGVVYAAIGVVGLMEAYKRGYNKGVDECKRMVMLAVEVSEAVDKKKGS